MIWSAFLLGFLGSAHCVVMCAPIMLSIKWKGITSLKILQNKAIYQIGRISTYILIGLLFYYLGRSFALANFQKGLSITIGSILLIWVLLTFFQINSLNTILLKLFTWLKKIFAPIVNIKGPVGSFSSGMLNGLLPCGLVYVAAFASVVQPSAIESIQYMSAFGVGTLPVIIAAIGGAHLAGNKLKLAANKLTPFFITILGLYFITRGLELNIPYLSPVMIEGVNDSTINCEPVY
ncbi:MAG: sulfite exporter TauE/SafE family protein [Bacteroidia bacterium]